MASHLGVQSRELHSNRFHITRVSVLQSRFLIHRCENVSSAASAHRLFSRIRSPVAGKTILCTTHMDSHGSFFLQRSNRSSEPGILLLGFETVNVLFNFFDLGSIFHNVQDEHVLVVIRADYGFCSTTGVHNNLVRVLVRDETVDRSFEAIKIGEYGFVSAR